MPTVLEMRIRRLKWYQSLISEPAHHDHCLAILLGQARFEKHPTIGEDGLLTRHANSAAVEFVADVMSLAELDDHRSYVEEWGGRVLQLFRRRSFGSGSWRST